MHTYLFSGHRRNLSELLCAYTSFLQPYKMNIISSIFIREIWRSVSILKETKSCLRRVVYKYRAVWYIKTWNIFLQKGDCHLEKLLVAKYVLMLRFIFTVLSWPKPAPGLSDFPFHCFRLIITLCSHTLFPVVPLILPLKLHPGDPDWHWGQSYTLESSIFTYFLSFLLDCMCFTHLTFTRPLISQIFKFLMEMSCPKYFQ